MLTWYVLNRGLQIQSQQLHLAKLGCYAHTSVTKMVYTVRIIACLTNLPPRIMNHPSEDEPAKKEFIQCEPQNTREREAVERDSDSQARPPDLRLATENQSLYLAGTRLKVDLLVDQPLLPSLCASGTGTLIVHCPQ